MNRVMSVDWTFDNLLIYTFYGWLQQNHVQMLCACMWYGCLRVLLTIMNV